MKTKSFLTRAILLSFVTFLAMGAWAEGNEKETKKSTETVFDVQLIIPDDDPARTLFSDPGIDDMSNYPEPFASSTTISYNLVRSGYVSLFVYIENKRIEIYSRDYQKMGSHHVDFNASNLPPGVYTCVLAFENEIRYEKMVKKAPFQQKKKYLED